MQKKASIQFVSWKFENYPLHWKISGRALPSCFKHLVVFAVEFGKFLFCCPFITVHLFIISTNIGHVVKYGIIQNFLAYILQVESLVLVVLFFSYFFILTENNHEAIESIIFLKVEIVHAKGRYNLMNARFHPCLKEEDIFFN